MVCRADQKSEPESQGLARSDDPIGKRNQNPSSAVTFFPQGEQTKWVVLKRLMSKRHPSVTTTVDISRIGAPWGKPAEANLLTP